MWTQVDTIFSRRKVPPELDFTYHDNEGEG